MSDDPETGTDVESINGYPISEIIEMAWEDKTSFDAIEAITGIAEKDVIRIMRSHLKPSSFRMWRKRVSGRKAKHRAKMHFKSKSRDSD